MGGIFDEANESIATIAATTLATKLAIDAYNNTVSKSKDMNEARGILSKNQLQEFKSVMNVVRRYLRSNMKRIVKEALYDDDNAMGMKGYEKYYEISSNFDADKIKKTHVCPLLNVKNVDLFKNTQLDRPLTILLTAIRTNISKDIMSKYDNYKVITTGYDKHVLGVQFTGKGEEKSEANESIVIFTSGDFDEYKVDDLTEYALSPEVRHEIDDLFDFDFGIESVKSSSYTYCGESFSRFKKQ